MHVLKFHGIPLLSIKNCFFIVSLDSSTSEKKVKCNEINKKIQTKVFKTIINLTFF